MTPGTTSILLRAADRVEFKGWWNGSGYAKRSLASGYPAYHDAGNCDENSKWAIAWSLIGAIWREKMLAEHGVLEDDGDRIWVTEPEVEAADRLARKLCSKAPDDLSWDASDWEKMPNRTAAEVARLLRAAALDGLSAC